MTQLRLAYHDVVHHVDKQETMPVQVYKKPHKHFKIAPVIQVYLC